ncbi:MAG: hypothetical protein R2854_05905 [Caldilineaceae bacterium]
MPNHQPPIVVFPEGRLGTGTELSTFQLGMFKLAKTQRIAYMPVAIDYERRHCRVARARRRDAAPGRWKPATFRAWAARPSRRCRWCSTPRPTTTPRNSPMPLTIKLPHCSACRRLKPGADSQCRLSGYNFSA